MTLINSQPDIEFTKIAHRPSRRRTDRTAIVIPCFNEAKRLNSQAFLKYLETTNHVDFIFVNDGSADDTRTLLKRLQSFHPDRITVLTLSQNSGKAEAVRQGLLFAASSDVELLGYWDADLATPLNAIDDFIRVAQRLNVSVIFGSRRQLIGHRIERTLFRRCVSKICATLARIAIGLPIGDTQCGAKLFRNTPAFRSSITEPFSAGWLFDVELFTRLSKEINNRHNQFYELPLCEWNEVSGSKVTSAAILKSGLRMLYIIAETRFGLSSSKSNRMELPYVHVVGSAASFNSISS